MRKINHKGGRSPETNFKDSDFAWGLQLLLLQKWAQQSSWPSICDPASGCMASSRHPAQLWTVWTAVTVKNWQEAHGPDPRTLYSYTACLELKTRQEIRRVRSKVRQNGHAWLGNWEPPDLRIMVFPGKWFMSTHTCSLWWVCLKTPSKGWGTCEWFV